MLEQVENVGFVGVDSVAVLFNFEHALRQPISEVSINYGAINVLAIEGGDGALKLVEVVDFADYPVPVCSRCELGLDRAN